MGEISHFQGNADIISLNPVNEIEYPVVTLGRHGEHFYDVRSLIAWVQHSQQNIFPHNRQRIDWNADLDVAEWVDAPNLPTDYVAKTRAYLEAARAYAPLWTDLEHMSNDGRDRVRRERIARYIPYRNYFSEKTRRVNDSFNALQAEKYVSFYWSAHPYTEEDREMGIRPLDPGFLQRHSCDFLNDEEREAASKVYRNYETNQAEHSFAAWDSESEDEDDGNKVQSQRNSAIYWYMHPPDPLKDDANTIIIIRDRLIQMMPYVNVLNGRIGL